MHRDPHPCRQPQTRWTLPSLQQACEWLQGVSLPGVHGILARLGVVWKRGRACVLSPDPDDAAKRASLAALRQAHLAAPDRIVLAYLDEVTIERQPTVAAALALRGHDQPRAWRSHTSNTLTRVVASLTDSMGQVVFRRASKIRLDTLVQFYQDLHTAYPTAERMYVVQDNWPVHTHPDVLVALEPQTSPFPFHRPGNWPTTPSAAAERKWGQLHLPIQIVPLPTYASWCNPIEKLWRILHQEVTHLHRWADDLVRLREEIDRFLTQFAHGSTDLLRYVGLSTGFNT